MLLDVLVCCWMLWSSSFVHFCQVDGAIKPRKVKDLFILCIANRSEAEIANLGRDLNNMLKNLPVVHTVIATWEWPNGAAHPVRPRDGAGKLISECVPDVLRELFTLLRSLLKMLMDVKVDSGVYKKEAERLHHIKVDGVLERYGVDIMRHHRAIHWHLVHEVDIIAQFGRTLSSEAWEHGNIEDTDIVHRFCRTGRRLRLKDQLDLKTVRRQLGVKGYVPLERQVWKKSFYGQNPA